MTKRKYLPEMALDFSSKGILILHPKDILTLGRETERKIKDLAEDCHIYLIVIRPRISYVPNSLVVGEESTNGKFRYYKNGLAKEVGFSLQGKANADSI